MPMEQTSGEAWAACRAELGDQDETCREETNRGIIQSEVTQGTLANTCNDPMTRNTCMCTFLTLNALL